LFFPPPPLLGAMGAEEGPPICEYVIQGTYVFASMIFVCGSCCFWPGIDEWVVLVYPSAPIDEVFWVAIGCKLFVVGSVIFACLSTYYAVVLLLARRQSVRAGQLKFGLARKSKLTVVDNIHHLRKSFIEAGIETDLALLKQIRGCDVVVDKIYPGEPLLMRCLIQRSHFLTDIPATAMYSPSNDVKKREVLEAVLYNVGSIIFTCGCIIWDPQPWLMKEVGTTEAAYLDRTGWLGAADALFMLGSFIFASAAYVNATGIHTAFSVKPGEVSLKPLRNVSIVISTSFAFGGFCFIAGTMGFIPARYMDCVGTLRNLNRLGTAFYLVGSVLYLVGSVLGLARSVAKYRLEADYLEKVQTIQIRIRDIKEAAKKKFLEKEKAAIENDTPDTVKHLVKSAVLQFRKRREQEEMQKEREFDSSDSMFWDKQDDDAAESIANSLAVAVDEESEDIRPLFEDLMNEDSLKNEAKGLRGALRLGPRMGARPSFGRSRTGAQISNMLSNLNFSGPRRAALSSWGNERLLPVSEQPVSERLNLV